MTSLGPGESGLVSVVIPVFNGQAFLAEAIESVLAQHYRPLEVITVDDGSSDDSPQILARYAELRVVRQANTGCTGARNRGVAESRGELIAFIDQDDRWRPDKLRRQVEALRAAPEAGYTLGHIALFLEPGCPMPTWMGSRGWLVGTQRVGYMPGTMLIRRTLFDRLGLFDARFHIGSDADWLVRARDAAVRAVVVPDVVLDKRIHGGNLSSHPDGSGDMLTILGESLKRRQSAESCP
jgi:glycosyltransferase involved in cell wall biosynthesis